MAGLGETCTHIAAVLFYLEANARIQGARSCTQEQCEWIIPAFLKKLDYQRIKDTDFTSAEGLKRKHDEIVSASQTTASSQSTVTPTTTGEGETSKHILKPTDAELNVFFESLSMAGTKPAILSLIPKYSDKYIPKTSLPEFPMPLTELHKPEHLELSYHELLKLCETVSVVVTEVNARAVEKETKVQHKTKLWHKYRAGRVTASRMKAVCRTDVSNPSHSLIKNICYPDAFAFTSKQTTYGCKHESQAKERYFKSTVKDHSKLEVIDSGLVLNPKWPHIGASPDGIVWCECCGRGALEIKCPYCHQGESIDKAATYDKTFCLKKIDGSLNLDKTHAYYYQVQTQMFVCDVSYCDFCVCTFTCDDPEPGLYIERIYQDPSFWENCLSKAEHFFKVCLLPELVGKWYTRPIVKPSGDENNPNLDNATSNNSSDHKQLYCYCNGPESGTMIACDNPQCTTEWFHLTCLKLTSTPRGKWYCPDCRKLPSLNKRIKRK